MRALRTLTSKTPKLRNSTVVPVGHSIGDVIKGSLHHLEHLLLHDARFFADADYKITFCHRFCKVICTGLTPE